WGSPGCDRARRGACADPGIPARLRAPPLRAPRRPSRGVSAPRAGGLRAPDPRGRRRRPAAGACALPRQARASSNRYRVPAMPVGGPTAGAGRGGGRGRAALAALALAALACARAPQPAAAWPPGALVAGSGRALAGLLAALARLEGTPLAREADAWAAALPGCEVVEAAAETASLAALRAGLRCADPAGPPAPGPRDPAPP